MYADRIACCPLVSDSETDGQMPDHHHIMISVTLRQHSRLTCAHGQLNLAHGTET